jgi:hypothetical protein
MPILPRILLSVATALVVITVTGCSRAALVYDNADWLAVRWSASLLDADGEQKTQWRSLYSAAVERHRGELLDDVVTLLDALTSQVEDGVERARLDCWVGAVDRSYRRHAELFVPVAVSVLGSIRTAQIDHLSGEFDERNAEYAERTLFDDPAEQQAERVDRFVERIEAWVGDLDAVQRRLVEVHVAALPDLGPGWLDYRRRQQQHLLSLLRAGVPDGDLEAFLLGWWRDLADRPAAMEATSGRLRDGVLAMLVDLDATLDPGQRAYLLKRIGDLRDGLARARTGGDPPGPKDLRLSCAGSDGVA